MKKHTVVLGYRASNQRTDYMMQLLPLLNKSHRLSILSFSQKSYSTISSIRIHDFSDTWTVTRYRIHEFIAKRNIPPLLQPILNLKMIIWYPITLFLYLKIKTFLRTNHADLLVVWNGHRWTQASMILAAKSIDIKIAFLETGYFPDHFIIDPDGVNAASRIPRIQSFYKKWASCYNNFPAQKAHPDNKKILIPMQIEHDSQFLLHSPWIKNLQHFITEAKILSQHIPKDWVIQIKPHPKAPQHNLDYLIQALDDYPNIELLMDKNAREALNDASMLVTINSTMGVEALELSIPVITLGDALYNIEGLVLQAQSTQILTDCVYSVIQGWKPQIDTLKGWLYFQKNKYHIYGDYRKLEPLHVKQLEERLIAIIESKPLFAQSNMQ